MGGSIAVWRRTADGALACAAPCLFCTQELQRFDLRVVCPVDGPTSNCNDASNGGGGGGAACTWFCGRLGEPGSPTPRLTGGQQHVLRQQGWQLCSQPGQPTRQQPRQQQRQQGQGGKRMRKS